MAIWADDMFRGFLEDNPNILYGGVLNQVLNRGWRPGTDTGSYRDVMTGPRLSSNFADYWRSQSGNVYNRYQAGLGETALGGQMPEQPYGDFLNQFNFYNEWNKLAPWARGQNRSPGAFWNIQ